MLNLQEIASVILKNNESDKPDFCLETTKARTNIYMG
jgi:hypothetical protein